MNNVIGLGAIRDAKNASSSVRLVMDKKYKDLMNDVNYYPYDIVDLDGNIVGTIQVVYLNYLNAYQVTNSKVKEKNKGYGKQAYIQLFKKFNKPVYSDSSLTIDAENLWKSLVKNGYAVYDKEERKYRSK